MLDREKEPFKLDVRKLKNLGLTLSLSVGYRISPRGAAYLRATTSMRNTSKPHVMNRRRRRRRRVADRRRVGVRLRLLDQPA